MTGGIGEWAYAASGYARLYERYCREHDPREVEEICRRTEAPEGIRGMPPGGALRGKMVETW